MSSSDRPPPSDVFWALGRFEFIRRLRQGTSLATPYLIGSLTMLLTVYLAFQSSQLNQADTALREYQDWQAQDPGGKLYTAWKMYRYERVLNIREPPLTQLDAYQKLVDSGKQLAEKGIAIQSLLVDASTLLYLPRFFEYHGPRPVREFVTSLNSSVAGDFVASVQFDASIPANATVATLPSYSDFQTRQAQTAPDAAAKVPSGLDQTPVQEAQCMPIPKPVKATRKAAAVATDPDESVGGFVNDYGCFLANLGLNQRQLAYSSWDAIYSIKSKINLLTLWLLPVLYGLLGACVFLMRNIVLRQAAGPASEITILTNLSFFLRIALGGLAGVIVGWFWVTPVSTGNSTPLQISSVPFGLAFLAGFSIETLFSLLDRLNRSVGGTAAAPASAPVKP